MSDLVSPCPFASLERFAMLTPVTPNPITTSTTIKSHGSESRTAAGHNPVEAQGMPQAATHNAGIGLDAGTILANVNAEAATAGNRTILQTLALAVAAQLNIARRNDETMDAFFLRIAAAIDEMAPDEQAATEARAGLKLLKISLPELSAALKQPDSALAARLSAMAEAPMATPQKTAAAVATTTYLQEASSNSRAAETLAMVTQLRSNPEGSGLFSSDAPEAAERQPSDARSLQMQLKSLFEPGVAETRMEIAEKPEAATALILGTDGDLREMPVAIPQREEATVSQIAETPQSLPDGQAERSEVKPQADHPLALPAALEAKQESGDENAADIRSSDAGTVDVKPADVKTADLKPADVRTTDLKTADVRLMVLKSTDDGPMEVKSADVEPTDVKSGDARTADLKSADGKTTDVKSADARATDLRSADGRTMDLKSTDAGSATVRSMGMKPQEASTALAARATATATTEFVATEKPDDAPAQPRPQPRTIGLPLSQSSNSPSLAMRIRAIAQELAPNKTPIDDDRVAQKAGGDSRVQTLLALKGIAEVIVPAPAMVDETAAMPGGPIVKGDGVSTEAIEKPASAAADLRDDETVRNSASPSTQAARKDTAADRHAVVSYPNAEDTSEATSTRRDAAAEATTTSKTSEAQPATVARTAAGNPEPVAFAYATLQPAKDEFKTKARQEEGGRDEDDNTGEGQEREDPEARRERLARKAVDDLLRPEAGEEPQLKITRDSSQADRAYALYQRMAGF